MLHAHGSGVSRFCGCEVKRGGGVGEGGTVIRFVVQDRRRVIKDRVGESDRRARCRDVPSHLVGRARARLPVTERDVDQEGGKRRAAATLPAFSVLHLILFLPLHPSRGAVIEQLGRDSSDAVPCVHLWSGRLAPSFPPSLSTFRWAARSTLTQTIHAPVDALALLEAGTTLVRPGCLAYQAESAPWRRSIKEGNVPSWTLSLSMAHRPVELKPIETASSPGK